MLKFTKSKAGNFPKNYWSVTKLKLDLEVMVTDYHAKSQVNIYKHLEKNSGKLLNRWCLLRPKPITKNKLDLQVMVTDLHAKNQVNIYKHLEKKSGKPFDRWNWLSPKPVILPKINGA